MLLLITPSEKRLGAANPRVAAICFVDWRGSLIPFPIISPDRLVQSGTADLKGHFTFSGRYSSSPLDSFILTQATCQKRLAVVVTVVTRYTAGTELLAGHLLEALPPIRVLHGAGAPTLCLKDRQSC